MFLFLQLHDIEVGVGLFTGLGVELQVGAVALRASRMGKVLALKMPGSDLIFDSQVF